ncbi:MAG: ABC transporter permease subunit, partial [Clostridia bacterium]|nr:ABC transporter permease subunit [Clostridia bacterium]
MSFIEVTRDLLSGFGITCLLFILTLLFALPLGLLVAFCSMSKFKPLKVVTRVFVWIVRGVPLMLQILIIVYLPGLLFKEFNIWCVVGKLFFNTFGIQFGNKG